MTRSTDPIPNRLVVVLGIVLLALLAHRSGHAVVLGRYSWGHVGLVAAYATACAAFLAFHRTPRWRDALSTPGARVFVAAISVAAVSVAGLAALLHAPLAVSVLAAQWALAVAAFSLAAIGVRRPPELFERAAAPALLLAAVLGTALAAELCLRTFWHVPHYLDRMAFPAKYPGNTDGFREREFGPKLAGTLRIVVLGDSNTFGWGVEGDEVFPRLLETSLRRQGHRLEVLNLGRPGLNTVEELALFDRFVPALHPDLVLLAYTTNDVSPPSANVVPSLIRFLPERFRDYFRPIRLLLLLDAWDVERLRRSGLGGAIDPAAEAEGLRLSLEALVAMRDRSAALGAPFAMFVIPALVDFDHYPLVALHDALASLSQQQAIPYLDLLETFRGSGLRAEQLNFGDGHPVGPGHALIAARLETFLAEAGLLPPQREP